MIHQAACPSAHRVPLYAHAISLPAGRCVLRSVRLWSGAMSGDDWAKKMW